MLKFTVAALALASASTCFAQAELEGAWLAKFSTTTGTAREARVSIKGEEGTWRLAAARTNREDPCIGMAIPFAISKSEDVYSFAMSPSKTMAGCGADYTLRFRKVDDQTYKGNFRDGREYVLSKQ